MKDSMKILLKGFVNCVENIIKIEKIIFVMIVEKHYSVNVVNAKNQKI